MKRVMLLPLYFLLLTATAAAYSIGSVSYPPSTPLNSSARVNVTVLPPANMTTGIATLLVGSQSLNLSNLTTQRVFSFPLDTSSLGRIMFNIILKLNNTYLFNSSYEYNVTPPPRPLRITPLKPSFGLGEQVRLNVSAPDGSLVRMVIYNTATNTAVYSSNITGGFPLIVAITSIKKGGTYSVSVLKQGFLQEMATFSITNTLSAVIGYEPEEPLSGQEVIFEAKRVSGGYKPYRYDWDFGDGKKGTGALVGHNFTKAGTFKVNLTITDSEGNKLALAQTIEVLTPYRLTVWVKDASTKAVVSGAEVIVGELHATTDTGGKAYFNLPSGRHQIGVYDGRYEPASQSVTLTKATTVEVLVNRIIRDEKPPVITLLSPKNRETAVTKPVTFTFRANDTSRINCSLMISTDKAYWVEGAMASPKSGEQTSLSLSQLGNGSTFWKVSCVDIAGNRAESEVRELLFSDAPQLVGEQEYTKKVDELTEATAEFKQELEKLLENYNYFNSEQKSVASLIGWEAQIREKMKQMDYYARDIFNLRFRKVNASERLELAKNLTKQFEEAKASTITSLRVASSQRLVYYPSDAELAQAGEAFLAAQGYTPSKYNLAPYHSENKKLQGKLSVTTQFTQTELEFFGGDTKPYTLVHREISGEIPENGVAVLEFIPFRKKGESLWVMGEYKELSDARLIQFPISTRSITYLLPGKQEAQELKKSHLLILKTKISVQKSQPISGFSIVELFHLNDPTGYAFLAALIVVVILAYYLLHSLGIAPALLCGIKGREEYRKLCKLDALAAEAKEHLAGNRVEEAQLLFREMELFFRELSPKNQERVYPQIQEVADGINLSKLDTLIKNAVYLTENSRLGEAKQAFNTALKYFNLLSEKGRSELHDRVASVKQMIEKNEAKNPA